MNEYIKLTIYILCGICLLLPLFILKQLNSDNLLKIIYISLILLSIIFFIMYKYKFDLDPDTKEPILNKTYLYLGIACIIPGIFGTSFIFYYITKKKKVSIKEHLHNINKQLIKTKFNL